MLESYRKYLWKDIENINKEREILLETAKSKSQIYTRTINLPDCKYEISWSVADIENIIKKNNIKKSKFVVNNLVPLIDQSNIVQNHLNNVVNNNNPVYITYNPAWNPNLCVIDGNHRIIAKYNANQNIIDGYIIEPKYHIEAMLFDIHKTMYKCHHNIYEYIKYMNKEKEISELNIYSL